MIGLLIAGWTVAAIACMVVLAMWCERRLRLEQAARARHEVRGPLTAVRLGLVLAARVGDLPEPRLQALDAELGRAAFALRDLGGGAVPFRRRSGRGPGARASRLESPDRVALAPLLDESGRAAEAVAAAAGATVCWRWCGVDAIVWGDRLRLAQALANLIANAVEHGGGDVRVLGELRDGSARITVDDDGPGLPAPVAVLVRRARGGRGVRGRGLAIAASIARAHAGSVAAGPVARGGRVVLTLPARAASSTHSARHG